jgi:hypothetical protein
MSHLTLEAMQEMFDNISKAAGWDMSQPKLFGYFFYDPSAEKLGDASYGLEDLGFRTVNIFVPELEEGEDVFYVLHVERVEVHSPESLHALNVQLEAFAAQHALAGYDGVDVGLAT